MILQSLVEFSRREGLVEDPLFSYTGVSWAIEIGPAGEFRKLRDLRTESTGKGPKKKMARQMLIPKRPIRPGQQTIPAFLVDNAEYVLGFGEQDEQRRATRRARFAETIENGVKGTGDPAALATLKFLRDDAAVQAATAAMQSQKFASQELICFRYEGEFLHEADALKEYWRGQHVRAPGAHTRQCLVCGNKAFIARLHTPIKSIPGASSAGVPLVSFNQSAFCSYGWEQNDNAPVCEGCVAAYATALNRCLSSQFPNPRDPESTLLRQAHNLGDNLTAVYWSDDPASKTEEAVNNVFRNPQIVKALLDSPFQRSTQGSQKLRFHCLLMQGAQGRATVRSYVAEPVAEMQNHLAQWLAETNMDPLPPFSLLQIMSSLALKSELSRLPPNLLGDLYLAILFHRRIPFAALQLAVTRNRVEARVSPTRAALLQAWRCREFPTIERKYFLTLHSESPSQGYQLGRLLAVCESVQRQKTKNLNKTLVDRYFPAMSTRPALVMAALLRLTKQIQSQISGRLYDFEPEITDILSRIQSVPASLSLTEQANFALGFYHQKWHRKAGSKEFPPPADNEPNSPLDQKETN